VPGSLEVDHQFKSGWLHDPRLPGFSPLRIRPA
jgi:hypothetical protein